MQIARPVATTAGQGPFFTFSDASSSFKFIAISKFILISTSRCDKGGGWVIFFLALFQIVARADSRVLLFLSFRPLV